jgi:hypothetical protein
VEIFFSGDPLYWQEEEKQQPTPPSWPRYAPVLDLLAPFWRWSRWVL